MIEARFYFILDDDQSEDGIFSRRCSRTEPDIVTALKPAVLVYGATKLYQSAQNE